MQEFIRNTFGTETVKENYVLSQNAPMYLKNEYAYCKYIINGQYCLFMKPAHFTLAGYRKHRDKLIQLSGMPVVAELDRITPYQRKVLIEERIPFVVKDTQLYLPFLGMSLTEKYASKIEIESFAPITQLVFLYYFYNNTTLTATEISQILNCTVMSATRAYKALTDCGLFRYDCKGRNKYIVAEKQGGELLKAAEKYFINPVERVKYYKNVNNVLCGAGLYALSKKTMLDISENDRCYAVGKDYKFEQQMLISEIEYKQLGGIRIEQWSYNPNILSQGNTVDDISLILSLKDTSDERVQIEIDELRRKYKW